MIKPNEILPIRTFAELMDATTTRLREIAFRITNLRPGGVFYTLLEMANQGLADLYELMKTTVTQSYVATATGEWLDLKAAEYEVYRKLAERTRGNVVFGRSTAGAM